MKLLLLPLAALLVAASPADEAGYAVRVERVLKATPLIDGHNDWAESLRGREGDARWTLDLRHLPEIGRLERAAKPYDTDIARLRKGRVGGQFWSAWVSAELPGLEQVKQTLEQIDLIKTIAARYPADFAMARTAADVRRIHKSGRIASMIGIEGGGQIDASLSVLRAYHASGAGYLTLTHSRTIEWADSATDVPTHGGLTPFGKAVVHELNRLGMLVDLSHVSEATMLDALKLSQAPVIFSHSGARALDDHPRDVSDAVLAQVKANGGVVMVVFARPYLSDAFRHWDADRSAEKARAGTPPFGGLYIGQPDRAAAALAAWDKAHPAPVVTVKDAADHIEHIVKVAGIDHVGIGSDFDGMGTPNPEGLEDVSHFPTLLAELMRRGWTDDQIAKLAGGNVLRVMEGAERVAAAMKDELPGTSTLAIDQAKGGAKPTR